MTDAAKKQHDRQVLLDHFRNPRGKDALTESDVISASRNPMCGDEVEVGVLVDDSGTADIRFRGRGCSVCIASASIMVETLSGKKLEQVLEEHRHICAWLHGESDAMPEQPSVRALETVRELPARKRCLLLAWEALAESLSKTNYG